MQNRKEADMSSGALTPAGYLWIHALFLHVSSVDWLKDWSQQINSPLVSRRISDTNNAWNVHQTNSFTQQENMTVQIRRIEMNSNPHTFLFIGLCMQQTSKARAEQRSLGRGLNRRSAEEAPLHVGAFSLETTAQVPVMACTSAAGSTLLLGRLSHNAYVHICMFVFICLLH